MPNNAWPGLACRAKAACERSAHLSDNTMARSASARSAGYSMHSSSCIWISAPSRHWISIERSGVSKCLEPSICERNSAPASLILRILERLITWKPPELVRIGPSPVHELVQSAQPRDALGARSKHEMVGVAEDDVGTGGLHLLRIQRFHRASRADRHERWRADDAARREDLAEAGRTVLLQEAIVECGHRCFRANGSVRRGRPAVRAGLTVP